MTFAGLADPAERVQMARLSCFYAEPQINVAQWAERHFVLSGKASAEPGLIRLDRTPYLRDVLEACSRPGKVVMLFPSQVGKTTALLAVAGYYLAEQHAPILMVQPTVELARTFSADRLAPMLADSPRLASRLASSQRRDSNDTLLHKALLDGGYVALVGSNAPSALASRPIRVVLADEIDQYNKNQGRGEGDVVELATARTRAWWNALVVLSSTPTIKGMSAIEAEFDNSTRAEFEVACPHCREFQLLDFHRLEKDPTNPRLACLSCGVLIDHTYKARMLAAGRWVERRPGHTVKGFRLNGLYSPFVSWAQLVREFQAAKVHPEKLRVFVNSQLAESWDLDYQPEEVTTAIAKLLDRREPLRAAPAGAFRECVVDVQSNRLEVLHAAFGKGEECWLTSLAVLPGNPAEPEVWEALFGLLDRERPDICLVDSGYVATEVYAAVTEANRRGLPVVALKGVGGVPSRGRLVERSKVRGGRLWGVWVDVAKQLAHARLEVETAGPGYVHFSDTFDVEFFSQLRAEKPRIGRSPSGRQRLSWRRLRARNEALDLLGYAYAGIQIFGGTAHGRLDAFVSTERRLPTPAPAPRNEEAESTAAALAGDSGTFAREQQARAKRAGQGVQRWLHSWH